MVSGDRPNMLELESSSEAQREAKARKSRGAFFTPGALTRVMVDWAIRSGSDRVLEVSREVYLDGDHLVEVASDSVADYAITVEVTKPSGT